MNIYEGENVIKLKGFQTYKANTVLLYFAKAVSDFHIQHRGYNFLPRTSDEHHWENIIKASSKIDMLKSIANIRAKESSNMLLLLNYMYATKSSYVCITNNKNLSISPQDNEKFSISCCKGISCLEQLTKVCRYEDVDEPITLYNMCNVIGSSTIGSSTIDTSKIYKVTIDINENKLFLINELNESETYLGNFKDLVEFNETKEI